MKTIVIYPGRFQPFGPHHFKSYHWLCNTFGQENVFIATSNVVNENNPLTFEEKKQCIEKYAVLKNNIVQVKEPYKSQEITNRFNSSTTSVIFAYGEKDAGRLLTNGKYFKEYYGQRNLEPFKDHGYILEMPNIHIEFQGQAINATFLRTVLPTSDRNSFEAIMGYYDSDIHFMFKKRFYPTILESNLNEGSKITRTQLQRIEQYADKLFKAFNIDINFQNLAAGTHFWQRLNDPRNNQPITADELRQMFRKASSMYGDKLSKVRSGYEAVLKDMASDINLPFIIKYDSKNKELDLVPKTIMRKKDFKTPSPSLSMESVLTTPYTKHIRHLYEDPDVDILEVARALLIDVHLIDYATLKFDGMNFKLTFKDERFGAARNKSTVINPMSVDDLVEKYKDKPNVQYAFKKAFDDLSNSLLMLGKDRLNDIFQNGRIFVNFEVYHPLCKNIYNYGDTPFISIHSLITYNENGNQVYETNDMPEFNRLQDGSVYDIQITPKYKLLPHVDSSEVNSILNLLRTTNDIKSTVLYLENLVVQNFCLLYRQLQNINSTKQYDFDSLFKSNEEDIYNIVTNVVKADRLKYEDILTKLNAMNGVNPIEGIVFKYRGNIYKCTGTFGLLVPIFGVYNKIRFNEKG